MARRRKATFEAYLVIIDEPQVILLKAGKQKIIAMAVPEDDRDFNFIATSVTPANWEKYSAGYVDLRYLFVYPQQRSLYTFNCRNFLKDVIVLDRHEDVFEEDLLPSPSFFATSHTELYSEPEAAVGNEKLYIDGEWGLQDFGKFYQRYSDIYAFVFSVRASTGGDDRIISRISGAYHDKPFRGGSSYVNFFDDIEQCVPAGDRLTLDAIRYASPGDVVMKGDPAIFQSVEDLIERYLDKRVLLIKSYQELWGFLSKRRLLTISGEMYLNGNPDSAWIIQRSRSLANQLGLEHFEQVQNLCNNNALVVAKVTLALHRRIESAAAFFAQGRMAFHDPAMS